MTFPQFDERGKGRRVIQLTQEEIDELINCPKVIIEAPKQQMKTEGRHCRNDMRLSAGNGEREFTAFMRQSTEFAENFSIGLIFFAAGGERLTLLRFNGPHGDHVNAKDPTHPHYGHHIHKATAEAIEAGLSPENEAHLTTDFADFSGALRHFLDTTNIDWSDGDFPGLRQKVLFDKTEDDKK